MSLPSDSTVGVALSGGGHRAACWSAGAVLGLVDAGVHPQITSISSVSGGSIANGVLMVGGDLQAADRAEVEGWLRPGLEQWAHDGMFFPGVMTDGWVSGTLALAALAVGSLLATFTASAGADRGWASSTVAIITSVIALVLAVVCLGKLRKLPAGRVRTSTYLGVAASVPMIFAATFAATASAWWLLLTWPVAVGAFLAAVIRFGGRSVALVAAMEANAPFAASGGVHLLGSFEDRPVHHVFCTTDLTTGNNLYLTNRLAWAHKDVLAKPGRITVASAVQASACLPGGFLARTIKALPTDPVVRRAVTLSDGGDYDNMADQWEWGFKNRKKAIEDEFGSTAMLDQAQAAAASHLIVVNASKGMEGSDRSKVVKPGLKGEFNSAWFAKDVLYDVSTATRRRLLIERFEFGHHDDDHTATGFLVHIGSTPYGSIERAAERGGPRGERAIAALAALDVLTDAEWEDVAAIADDDDRKAARRAKWSDVAKQNAGVKTTLAPLETLRSDTVVEHRTADLLWHACVLARINAHVFFAAGDLPAPDGDHSSWRRQRFVDLVAAAG